MPGGWVARWLVVGCLLPRLLEAGVCVAWWFVAGDCGPQTESVLLKTSHQPPTSSYQPPATSHQPLWWLATRSVFLSRIKNFQYPRGYFSYNMPLGIKHPTFINNLACVKNCVLSDTRIVFEWGALLDKR